MGCGNFDCSRLDGPCEMTVKTLACEGGCGARYCCQGLLARSRRGGEGTGKAIIIWKIGQARSQVLKFIFCLWVVKGVV